MRLRAFASFLALASVVSCQAWRSDAASVSCDFVVAEGGRLRADVVLAAKPTDVERFAADELADHLAKAMGSRPEIVLEDALVAGKFPFHFFVGRTKAAKSAGLADCALEPEERLVRQVGNGLYLLGGDRPCAYGKMSVRGNVARIIAA